MKRLLALALLALPLAAQIDISIRKLSATDVEVYGTSHVNSGATWNIQSGGTLAANAGSNLVFHTDLTMDGSIYPTHLTETLGDVTHKWLSFFVSSLNVYGSSFISNGATLNIQSGGALTANAGSTLTFHSDLAMDGSIYPTHLTETLGDVTHKWLSFFVSSLNVYGSSFISNGATLNIQSGGTLAVNAGSTFTVDSTGAIKITNPSLSATGVIFKDASGTTTGNSMELQTNGGTIYFKVIGGTDAGAPGTVVTRSLVPFTDNLYIMGNSTHMWNTVYSYSYAAPGGGGISQTLSCGVGLHVNSVTVSAGVIVAGFTCN